MLILQLLKFPFYDLLFPWGQSWLSYHSHASDSDDDDDDILDGDECYFGNAKGHSNDNDCGAALIFMMRTIITMLKMVVIKMNIMAIIHLRCNYLSHLLK